ncbi:glutamine amidotransferase [Bacillus oleivorans]|uniref:Imidazole glycerol phosphate synthase subunit HisH n=1 Tax=Bacillus oleivorans TaxID=1448271 RepID=A0A285D090_9BACI|nr:imidazole glycerol phosphate synthase subunit HisH [Bacillus oleivorans]SNX72603.1 glutamine amidotransferase [Bacillus oleivorans]
MIGVIDYGMGNLFSVQKALERLEVPFFVSESIEELENAAGLILPGVGAFPDAMKKLTETDLVPFIERKAAEGVPLLGICLGMQLLFSRSEEHGEHEGLGLLEGEVVRFSGKTENNETYKVPHIGWNKLVFHKRENELLSGLDENFAYFVHSFYVQTDEDAVMAYSDYFDVKVPAIVGRANVYGMQFHPEKSSRLGMQLLSNFTKLAGQGEKI